MNTELIISMGLVGVMLSMLFMGLLIAYYGSSKTRNVGIVFLLIGVGLAYYLTLPKTYGDVVFLDGRPAAVLNQ